MLASYKVFSLTVLKWISLSLLIGIVVGTTTSFLLTTNDFLGTKRENHSWLIYFLPIGGLLIGYLYMNYGKNDAAKGNNLIIEGVQGKKKVLKRMGPLVYIGTFITIIFGGSTGREGAAVQMGGSIAQMVNQFLKVKQIDMKIFLMCGVSAGFGAAFGTPIAGAIFGMEFVAVGKLKYEAFVACLISSFVGHYVAESVWGIKHESLIIQTIPDPTLQSFGKVIILAVLFGLVSVLYCQLRHGIQKISEKLTNKNHMIRAFTGGVIIIVLTLIIGNQEYNGRGLEMFENSFVEEVPPFAFLAKLIFTAVTLGTGFVGGEAIPLFFIGSTLGNALSGFFDLPLSFLAGLGMIAVFCGGANTPLTAFLMSVEMFDGKGIEFFFVACLISYLFSGHHGLWPSQTLHEPKSRLFTVKDGSTIESIESSKK